MGMNFQDVLRDVHDPNTHTLQVKTGNVTVDIEIGAVELKNSATDDRLLVTPRGTLVADIYGFSYYQQASLISGYTFHGFAVPGSNPTTANFKILREELYTGSVLFGNGNVSLLNTWSSASLASISYS